MTETASTARACPVDQAFCLACPPPEFSGCDSLPLLWGRESQPLNRDGGDGAWGAGEVAGGMPGGFRAGAGGPGEVAGAAGAVRSGDAVSRAGAGGHLAFMIYKTPSSSTKSFVIMKMSVPRRILAQ